MSYFFFFFYLKHNSYSYIYLNSNKCYLPCHNIGKTISLLYLANRLKKIKYY